MAKGIVAKEEVGVNRICRILSISKGIFYYKAKLANDEEIKKELGLLVTKHPSRGFGKFFNELKNMGKIWNHKRVYRVYTEMGLNLRKKPKKRLPAREAKELYQPLMPNECWSIDFMSDATTDGRKFRTLNVLDDFNRACLTVSIARSLPTSSVIAVLDSLALQRGYPKAVRVDNGPEYISKAFLAWAKEHGVELMHIQPGKPAQNGYIERFNRTYREEVLDMYLFDTINEVKHITKKWLEDYNGIRPHNALNNMSPQKFSVVAGF